MLRAILLLLACMNLGVAAWWWSHREAPAPPLPSTEPGVPGLRLLAEVADRPLYARVAADKRLPARQAARELAEPPAPLSADAQCLSLGPFETPAALREAMDRLLPRVERIQFREVPAVALRGYRVYLPPAESREAAFAVARDLAPSVTLLKERYAEYDEQGIRVVTRYDAAPLNPEAVVKIVNVAAG